MFPNPPSIEVAFDAKEAAGNASAVPFPRTTLEGLQELAGPYYEPVGPFGRHCRITHQDLLRRN